MADAKAARAAGESADAMEMASDPSGHSIFASLQRLGLKLESRKAPFERFVVDHLEKEPTAN